MWQGKSWEKGGLVYTVYYQTVIKAYHIVLWRCIRYITKFDNNDGIRFFKRLDADHSELQLEQYHNSSN